MTNDYHKKIKKFLSKLRRDIVVVVPLLVVSVIFSLPLFSHGFVIGHDNVVQLANAAARIEAIKDLQFPVRWAGDLNFGYGNPSFVFYYSLGGYLVALLYFLGLSLEPSYSFLLATSFVLAPLTFYLWMRQNFKPEIAIVGAFFYGLAPYLFLDIYVRGHLGESLSLALAPLVFLYIDRNFNKPSLNNALMGGLSFALLIHSHAIMSLIFSVIFGAYVLIKKDFGTKPLFLNISALVIGLTFSAYFWLPALLEAKYINSALFVKDWYSSHFIQIKDIIYSTWGYGSNINEDGGLSAQVGPVHFIIAILSVLLIFAKDRKRKEIAFWLVCFLLAIGMSTDISRPIWERIHTFQRFQFPWRFTAIAVFSAASLASYFFSRYNKNWLKIIAISLLIIFAIPMMKAPPSQNYGDEYYFEYLGTTTFHNEATTIWVEGDAYSRPKSRIEVIEGEAVIREVSRRSNKHIYEVEAVSDAKLLDNTVYFPGWRTYVDGKNTLIEFQDPNHRGLITFEVPKGKHEIVVKFGESPIRLVSNAITIVGLILLFVLYFSRKWVRRYL